MRVLTAQLYAVYNFDGFEKLPASLQPTSKHVMKFASNHYNSESKAFDWGAFKTAVDNFHGQDIVAVKSMETTIAQNGFDTQAMLNNVAAVSDLFWPGMDRAQMKASLDAIVDIPRDTTFGLYYIVFAANPFATDHLYGLVITIRLQMVRSPQKLSAVFDTMMLDVKQGFRAPPR